MNALAEGNNLDKSENGFDVLSPALRTLVYPNPTKSIVSIEMEMLIV
jgi:hypothetical protein